MSKASRWTGGSRRARAALGLFWVGLSAMPGCGGESDHDTEGQGGEPSCESLSADYARALGVAQTCDPEASEDPCTTPITEGLACGCTAFANPAQADAIAAVAKAQSDYSAKDCAGTVVCGPCAEPTGARCSASGRCEAVYGQGGRGCKVDGVTYADGEGGIPDPVSCNRCSCVDGELACTEIGCPVPCPMGEALGKQCAACGPTDACLVVEHACFPSCTDACTSAGSGSFCLNGVCVSGVCG